MSLGLMSNGSEEAAAIPALRRPDLLVRPGATWGWWKEVILRAPGFPATGVSRLAAPSLAKRADELAAAGDTGQDAWRSFGEEYDATMLRLATVLQEIAASDDFQRAVAWQNHHVLGWAIDPLLRWRPGVDLRNSKHRQHEDLVAMYWQRYCVKNDSIGFFGPIGWGRADAGAPATSVRPGAQLLDSFGIFFEPWTIDRLADVLSAEPRMRRWIPPRRVPYLRVDLESVRLPGSGPVPVTAAEAAVLRASDGTAAASRLADRANPLLAERGRPGLSEADVASVLAALEKRRWIVWKIEIPVGPYPDEALRRFLETVGDRALRRSALAKLDTLTAAREQVRSAAGEAAPLRRSLAELDSTFTGLTGTPATRNPGKTYGGRTLVYLDARRAVELRVGRDVLDAAAPLDLIAAAARWICFRLSEELRPALLDVYRRLDTDPDRQVDLATYWFESFRPMGATMRRALEEIETDLVSKWAALLRLDPEASLASYSAAALGPAVHEAFHAPAAGWNGARYCGPDLLIAARDLSDVARGDFQLVAGDFHVAINTHRTGCFLTQHPDPQRLVECLDRDSPRPRLLPVLPKESPPRLSVRTHPALVRDRDFMVAVTHQTVRADRPRLVPGTDVAVTERDGVVVAVLPTGEVYDVLDVFAEILMDAVIDRFRMLPEGPHLPRVAFDRLVVSRESWNVDARRLEFAFVRDESRRFAEARAWRAGAGIPERAFVKSPREMKPFYVDFESPVYVNVLAKAVRAAAEADETASMRFVEMLPTLEQLWLSDARGNRYTAELRLVGFDLVPAASEAAVRGGARPGRRRDRPRKRANAEPAGRPA